MIIDEMLDKITTWEYWHECVEHNTCLTAAGREVGHWAVNVISEILGANWLKGLKGKEHIMNSLEWSPCNQVPHVYANLFKFAALISLLSKSKNFNRIKKSLRQNLDSSNWFHELIQLEIACLGLRYGWESKFEPALQNNRRADIFLSNSMGKSMLFEIVNMGASYGSLETDQYFHDVINVINNIKLDFDIHSSGYIGEVPESEQEKNSWLAEIELTAKEVAQSDIDKVVKGPTGGTLRLSKHPFSQGISGPVTISDELGRIKARIKDKARQTKGAKGVWIRFDEYGGLWYFTKWAYLKLEFKLSLLDSALNDCLSLYPHISGIIISNGWGWKVPGLKEETIRNSSIRNTAIRRFLPNGTFREVIIIGQKHLEVDEIEQLSLWYSEENTWLDWALNEVGFPGFSELIRV